MNYKEVKINIEVNIAGERLSLNVPFPQQDFVRKTESEIKFRLKELRDRFPGKGQKELLAMMVYHYASNYYSLAEIRENEIEEAEQLLKEAAILCGDQEEDSADSAADEFDVY